VGYPEFLGIDYGDAMPDDLVQKMAEIMQAPLTGYSNETRSVQFHRKGGRFTWWINLFFFGAWTRAVPEPLQAGTNGLRSGNLEYVPDS
jgi:hypothetical protein